MWKSNVKSVRVKTATGGAQKIAVRMNNGEPVQNVPRSIKEEGHQILKLTDNGDDTFTLIVKKVAGDFFQSGYHTKCSRFTTSGRSYENDEFFVFDFKVEVFNGFETVWICLINVL